MIFFYLLRIKRFNYLFIPKDCAIFLASSEVLATPPLGTATPASFKMSRAMYSWTAKLRFGILVAFGLFDDIDDPRDARA